VPSWVLEQHEGWLLFNKVTELRFCLYSTMMIYSGFTDMH
jgi:hypothetical protein